MTPKTGTTKILCFGIFEVDLRAREIRKLGERIKLQDQPFQVLSIFLQRPHDVVTREELRSQIWPQDTFVDFDNSLNTAINKLRDALGDSAANPRFIETLPRRGYRFLVPIIGPEEENGADASRVEGEKERTAEAHVVVEGDRRPRTRRAARWLVAGVAVGLALLAATYVVFRSQAAGARGPKINSLAVLPLRNLSGDPAQEYFADGMTEAVIGRLSMIRGLRVVSRTSVVRFKDTRIPLPEIAKTLGVDAIVEGSVLREGGRVRVHAQLIRAATDEHFWSEAYDREMGDVLALESDVARSIAEKVEVTVSGQEHSRLVATRHVSPEVYESYLKGQYGKGNSKADFEESIRYFEAAIGKDPTFAPAYVGLAGAYDSLGSVFVGTAPDEVRAKAISALGKALELDPEVPRANLFLAQIYSKQWRWAESEAEFKRALALNPNDVAAHITFAYLRLFQGRTEEAVTWSQHAREVDPLGDLGVVIGWILFQSRRYDEAIRELRSVLAVHPDEGIAHWFLGFALIANGQSDEAIPVLNKALSLTDNSPAVMGVLVRAYAHSGRRTEALRLLDELKRRRRKSYVPTEAFVNAYLGIGDNEQAFVWLERAYQEKSEMLLYLKVLPFFDPLRSDPRFAELIRRVGLDRAS